MLLTYIRVCLVTVQGDAIGRIVPVFGVMRIIFAGIGCVFVGNLVITAFSIVFAGGGTWLLNIIFSTSFVFVGFSRKTQHFLPRFLQHHIVTRLVGALGLVQGFGPLGRAIGRKETGHSISLGVAPPHLALLL